MPWTESETSRLLELAALTPPLSWHTLAVEMNCSRTRVHTRLAELGIEKPDAPHVAPGRKRWAQADLWWLAELCLLRPRLSWSAMAEHFEFGEKTVRNMCTVQGYIRDPQKSNNVVRNEKILELARLGFKAVEIAQQTNVSRATVAGVCDRNGVHLSNRQYFNVGRKLKAARVKKKPPAPIKYETLAEAQEKAGIWRPINGRAPVGLLELEQYQCRWPLWETDAEPHVFCGCNVDRGGWTKFNVRYCDQHYADATSDQTEQRVQLGSWPTTWTR